MSQICYIQILVNGHQSFFLNEKVMTKYSERLKKIIKEERSSSSVIEINGFPGGSTGFELVSRFCYNNGRIKITVSNVSLLHCCSIFLGMTNNLLKQTESFLEGVLYWSWSDIISGLKSCESIFIHAYSCGLIEKLIWALLAKIAQNNSDSSSLVIALPLPSSSSLSSPSSSSETSSPSPTKTNPESIIKPCLSPSPCSSSSSSSPSPSPNKAWWFDDLTILSPLIIEKIIKSMGAYGVENDSLLLTRFLLHYLKTAAQSKCDGNDSYSCLADTVVNGVIFLGKCSFSCRKLFWVLRILSNFGISKENRAGLEKTIGGMLDEATLDDLLVSSVHGHGHGHGRGIYDVNLVIRLIKIFVNSNDDDDDDLGGVQKLKKVGKLIDKYLGEISPDQKLRVSKFLGVAESLPDSARDCFDGVYRAVDIYLESHPSLTLKERSEICRCLNYKKLSFEASKELAKNPRIPPIIAMQALKSQHSKLPSGNSQTILDSGTGIGIGIGTVDDDADGIYEENERMRMNLQRMQWRVMELEKVCKEMKGHMHKMVRHHHDRGLPKLC